MSNMITKKTKVLYIKTRCPIQDVNMIKALHPKIKTVRLPRQKNARFCLVKFRTPKVCSQVKKELKDKTLDGERIYAKYRRIRKPAKIKEYCIIKVKDLPKNIKRRDLKKTFPKVLKIKLKRPRKRTSNSYALLVFKYCEINHGIRTKKNIKIKDTTLELQDVTEAVKRKVQQSFEMSRPRYFESTEDDVNFVLKKYFEKPEKRNKNENNDENRKEKEEPEPESESESESEEETDSEISFSSCDFSSDLEESKVNLNSDSDD